MRSALASGAVLAATLTACSGGPGGSDGKAAGAAEMKGKTAMAVSVNLTGNAAKAGGPVKVTLTEGSKLAQVDVTDAKGGRLTGRISADGKTWTSERNASPGTAYKVTARDSAGTSADAQFTTAAADRVNKITITPGKGSVMGIAQPLSLVFDNPVTNKAEVEKHLKVTTSNNTEGSWGWMKDYSGKDRVDWRPREYWKSGTDVKLVMELNGVDSGKGGGYFVRDYETGFKVGRNQRIAVDLDSKTLKLTRDGREVKSIPVSAGTPGGQKASWEGKLVVMAKEGTIRMDSQTVGLGDAYDKMVDYSMRLTWSGMYAHAAPWNAGAFGRANTSSGCVGMSTSNAADLYGEVQPGDPFEVTGSGSKGKPDLGNGYSEWNLSWADWQAKSALKGSTTQG
ncbi:Ig-like domain-containing protein [Streptomyces bambusae]|nr:Ig-like domain-containing protein [Streptomyces bambusae]MCB5169515.1 Ig-like domain-containing protein [Streptomyces bambusae]